MFSAFGKGSPPLGPGDVAMMQELVKDYCRTNAIEPDSEEGRDVARDLLKWFQIGVRDRYRLRERLASRN